MHTLPLSMDYPVIKCCSSIYFDNWGGFQQVSSLFQNFTLTCHLSFIIGVGSGSPWTNTWWKNQLESLLVCLKFHPVSMRNYKPNAKCFLSPV